MLLGCVQEPGSLQTLLGEDPAPTLIDSVLFHRVHPLAYHSPQTGGSQPMAVTLSEFYLPILILGENQPIVGLPFPELSSSLFLKWNTYLFIQFQVL